MKIRMNTSGIVRRALAVTVLSLALVLVVGGAYVSAYQSPPYPFPPTFPANNFDFTLSTSATLLRLQPGQSGGLFVWVDPYCPDSSTPIRCDATVLQSVSLIVSGCPAGAVCVLDRPRAVLPPLYPAASTLAVYTFSTIPVASAPYLVTVTGTDQFGDTHSTSFGLIVCYC